MTPRAETSPRFGIAPAKLGSAANAEASTSRETDLRHLYVIGSFGCPTIANLAVQNLGNGPAARCEVLLLTSLENQDLDAAALKLRKALIASRPFELLWDNLSSGDSSTSPTIALPTHQRIYGRLVQHLALGATVAIVYACSPEAQLIASRALLDSGCDILLTHEVLTT